MAVPETSMDKYRHLAFAQHKIRSSSQGADMKSVTIASAMKKTSHEQFRPGITPPDSAHHSRANLFANDVNHWLLYS